MITLFFNSHYQIDTETENQIKMLSAFENRIDLTSPRRKVGGDGNGSSGSGTDIEIMDTENDEQYARRLQEEYNQRVQQWRREQAMADAAAQRRVPRPFPDYEISADFPFGNVEDAQPFHFVYPGMHGYGDNGDGRDGTDAVGGVPGYPVHAVGNGADEGEKALKELLDNALKQEDVKPIKKLSGMTIDLFDHQKKGVAWMMEMEENKRMRGGLLGDQMGVGKTIQIIALMKKSRDKARKRAEEQWKKKGHLDSDDEEVFDDEDSNDETLNGFVVGDDEVDFRSDADNDSERTEDEWSPNIHDDDTNDNNNNDDNNKKRKSETKRVRKRKRKFNEMETQDSEATIAEEEDTDTAMTSKKKNDDLSDPNDSEYDPEDDDVDILGRPLHSKKVKKQDEKKMNLFSFFDSGPPKKRRKQSGYKPWLNQMKRQRTLIIGPLAIIDQWAEEIQDKCPGEFSVVVYHGSGRKRKWDKRTLRNKDVVITTFGHISSEWKKGNEEKQDGLFKLPMGFFHRVVLDEAHTIKNPSSDQSKSCAEIGNRGVRTRYLWLTNDLKLLPFHIFICFPIRSRHFSKTQKLSL